MARGHEYFHRVWLALCLIGNVIQIEEISSTYFKYGENVEVRIEYPERVYPPANVICFNFLEVINWTHVTVKDMERFPPEFGVIVYSAIHQEVSWKSVEEYVLNIRPDLKLKYALEFLNGKTIDVDLRNIILSPSFIFPKMLMHIESESDGLELKEYSYENFSSKVHVSPSIQSSELCFTFRMKQSIAQNMSLSKIELSRNYILNNFFYGVFLNQDIQERVSYIKVGYLNHDEHLNYGANKMIGSQLPQGACLAMTFKEIQVDRLKPPYESACRDYGKIREDGLISTRSDCVDDCMKDLSEENFGAVMPGIGIEIETDNGTMYFPFNTSNEGDHAMLRRVGRKINRIVSFCASKCKRPDCHSSYFIPDLISIVDFSLYNGIATYVLVFPSIFVTSKPIVSFLQVITDVFSTFSTWLGISTIDFISVVPLACNQFGKMEKTDVKVEDDDNSKRQNNLRGKKIRRDSYSARLAGMAERNKQMKDYKWYTNPDDSMYEQMMFYRKR